LKSQFVESGQRKDLEEAISLHRNGLKLRPPPNPERLSSLNNLAAALYARFEQSCQRQDLDLDEAMSLYREQLELLPSTHHPRQPDALNNIAGALMSQFERLPVSPYALQIMRLSDEARHAGRAPNARMQSEVTFGLVLVVLWVSVAASHSCIEIRGKSNLFMQDLSLSSSTVCPESETPPLLQWCPAGLFAFLPIHTAGLYGTDAVENDVISSYVPTMSALLSTAPLPTSSFKMMAVIQPRTLPCTAQEIQEIGTYVRNECLVRLGIPGAPVSVEEVVSHLPTVSIVHFACHGQQNTRNPLESALILEDGSLKVSRIMRQSIPNASLAFLCACETAMGDENFPDEAIHLGATLLFAGFRGVVATM
jgi:hypothetical protein